MDVLPIVYSPAYNFGVCGLPKSNPLDPFRNKHVWQILFQKGFVDNEVHSFWSPSQLPSRKWLLELMTPFYLFLQNYNICLSKYLRLPICCLPAWFTRHWVLESQLLAT